MRIAGVVGGALIALMGGIWTLQGFNASFAPRSFMTGSGTWVIAGAITFIGGLALARWSWGRR